MALQDYVKSSFDPTLTWNDLKWLKTITKLPIVVKGILHPDDAVLAIKVKDKIGQKLSVKCCHFLEWCQCNNDFQSRRKAT